MSYTIKIENQYRKMRIFSLSVLVFFFLNCIPLFSENGKANTPENRSEISYEVKWIKSFHSPDEYNKDKSFTQRIFEFIIGDENSALNRPYAVLINSDEKIWVLDQGLHALVAINSDFKKMNVMPFYPSPIDICADKLGKIYFTDSKNNTVYILNHDSSMPVKFNLGMKLNRPTGIAYAAESRQIWVVETGAHQISIFNPLGEYVKTIGKRGEGAAEFNFPTSITIDEEGYVYIVDSMNFRVQIFNIDGNFVNMFGSAGDKPGYFSRPKGIATSSKGHIFIVEAMLNAVQVFNREGEFLYIFGQYGKESKNFRMPSGIYIDENDNIFLADSYNSSIHVFQLMRKYEN